jgi:ornithine lipid ester-linked acyl 2-hydroxylase
VLLVDVIRKLPWYLAAPNRAFIGAIRRSPFIKRAVANNEAWQETLGAMITPPRCTET